MNTFTAEPLDSSATLEEWTGAINALLHQIESWTHDKGWSVDRHPRQIEEEGLGVYAVPDATIVTPFGTLLLEVKGRGASGGAGRVELAAWPTLYRVLLLHKPGQRDWTVRTDSGIRLRQPWTKENFLALAEDLLAAE
jgi:hypothetical protein